MLLYALIMLAAAIVCLILGIQIHNGKTELIHDYHQKKVRDKAAYGKAFGKAMVLMAASLGISGIIALFGEAMMGFSMAVLAVGLVISIGWIVAIQKKYNNGVF